MGKGLPKGAYGGIDGADYVPYVTDSSKRGANIPILTFGIILAIVFAASTAYSGMKAGLTVAAGIPGAIIGSAFVAAFARHKGILGKNITQGMSSGGEATASGLIFVLPAVLLIGSHFNFWQGMVVGVGGVLFGIGGSTLVYKYLIVEEHGKLIYPESMAISESLVAGETGGQSLKFMGIGFGIGGVITALTSSVFNVANNVISYVGDKAYKWKFGMEVNPMLLGIGFIVGLQVSLRMFAGSILANFAINPLMGFFAGMAGSGTKVWNNSSMALNQMDASTISSGYGKYIGAGMMLCGGLISAIRLVPTIISSVRATLGSKSMREGGQERLASDMIILLIGVGLAFIGGFAVSGGNIGMALLGAVLALVLSLLFVIVSGHLTGTIGTSNLPVSGMTIAALVIVTAVFVGMGWTSKANNTSLLLFGSFIVVAISVAGGYNQTQKVTYIIGGSKNEMQRYFTIAGVVGTAVVVSVIMLLTSQLTVTDNPSFALPQANLMATLTSGVMQGNLPWAMIIAGVVLAIVLFFLDLPIMTVAIGFYLPITTTSIILVGALIRVLVEKLAKSKEEQEERVSTGVSLSAGLVAGGSIIGLIGIILQVTGVINVADLAGFAAGNSMAIILLIVLVGAVTTLLVTHKVKGSREDQQGDPQPHLRSLTHPGV